MGDTPTGETANQETPSNNANPTATPAVNAVDTAEVERLKKEAEQARMRANQLENELKKKAEAEEAARLKQLEENEEWKSLAEQNAAKVREYEERMEREARQKELESATNEVFADYPQEVVEIAKEAGLSVTDASEEGRAAIKQKLDNIAAKVSKEATVTPNNPASPAINGVSREELMERTKYGDKTAARQLISELPAVQEMRKMAGVE